MVSNQVRPCESCEVTLFSNEIGEKIPEYRVKEEMPSSIPNNAHRILRAFLLLDLLSLTNHLKTPQMNARL